MSYSEKLKDPRWQKKRLEVFERDKFQCQACDSKDKTLHVHHLKYEGEPWESPMEYLETLCEDCHEARTSFDDFWKNHWSKTKCVLTTFTVFRVLYRLSERSKRVESNIKELSSERDLEADGIDAQQRALSW
jgi:transposase